MMPDSAGAAAQARLAEAHGFSHYWVADSELMAADPYVALTAAALATKRLVLGTGVAIVGTRIAPVTACAIASVGALAPGRVVLGLGTGNSARRAMGMPPYRVSQLREHVRVVRGLLGGGKVDYREGEMNRAIRLFHQHAHLSRREQLARAIDVKARRFVVDPSHHDVGSSRPVVAKLRQSSIPFIPGIQTSSNRHAAPGGNSLANNSSALSQTNTLNPKASNRVRSARRTGASSPTRITVALGFLNN
jgi:alkanesulfonate monooxygenase SsuD/methylene tetrahydromethanopterin reductase-like flavin-dependent oxidoreductase (luciferase family)